MDLNNNLNNLMKEAQKMQERMQEAQQSLEQLKVLGESGGGKVKINMNGRHDVTRVHIDPALIQEEDQQMLEDLIAAAINDAVRKVERVSREKIAQLTEGFKLPDEFISKDDDKK